MLTRPALPSVQKNKKTKKKFVHNKNTGQSGVCDDSNKKILKNYEKKERIHLRVKEEMVVIPETHACTLRLT